jgi:hypothetical protein
MASSLDALSQNLKPEQLINLSSFYSDEKGVYPYYYMDGLSRFEERTLPPKSEFYSKLNDTDISEEDYPHAQHVWETFDIKNMKEYHNLYLKTDTLLLSDVFESFRDVCYDLDSTWYYTSPGLAWDAALKKTDVSLELLSDPDMLLMREKGIRGGVSTITTRYSKANNPYMEEYNPQEPTKYIQYLDANNLHGAGMSRKLPTHGFEWMTQRELGNWEQLSSEPTIGCILEVDLEHPTHLHKFHNDYPLAPETLRIGNCDKLIPNLHDKTKYLIHYENLKQYRSLGLVIKCIHRGIRFQESAWLKSYIDLNTKLRTEGKAIIFLYLVSRACRQGKIRKWKKKKLFLGFSLARRYTKSTKKNTKLFLSLFRLPPTRFEKNQK